MKKVTVGNERRLERRRVTKKRGGAGAEERGGGRGEAGEENRKASFFKLLQALKEICPGCPGKIQS